MEIQVSCVINREPRQLRSEAQRTLLEVLREDLALTGTKFGCGEGRCGACTVLLDGRAVRSCQTAIEEVRDHTVVTIEGVAGADGTLHPVQQAFIDEEAMQCGYCVPGMILSAVDLLERHPSPSREQIVTAMNGNLCRCCGYVNLLKAVDRAARSNGGRP